MHNPQLEIQVLASLVAVTCTLPGVFLVLRKMAMMSDAISHSILAGIAVAFIITGNIHSPLLIIGAAFTGIATVFLVEMFQQTKLVSEDASIGMVFTALFSIGVIIISRYAGNVHLDIDAVLLGEIAFAPFNRLIIRGYDLGPKSLYVMLMILILNIIFIAVFYKELKIVTFDPKLAAVLGISPAFIHYGLMGMVSLTAVGAFDAVGSILVVALMVVPPLTAYLISDKLEDILFISCMIGIAIGILGYQLAGIFDVSIAGAMATIAGIIFMLIFLLGPRYGLIATIYRRQKQKGDFAELTLLMHIYDHETIPEEEKECHIDHIKEVLQWEPGFVNKLIKGLIKKYMLTEEEGILLLTKHGRQKAEEGLVTVGLEVKNKSINPSS
ncbi:ABC-type Mn2+/Zn2+ transport systems, permease component [Clostridium aceticum]|uniref:ABC-type Mn2+/Zn2+ transport systems, permease component n=1 Tax=Clostridium aceticum TaxID=84022 RepID=A0A0G3W865_9CLOT|nr:metal ABC transporter permease [Clostridium aceticum]AKL94035.1 ABC-type Mn2+/Zn2+ transport systems, permease component [Clostridium aceticum]